MHETHDDRARQLADADMARLERMRPGIDAVMGEVFGAPRPSAGWVIESPPGDGSKILHMDADDPKTSAR